MSFRRNALYNLAGTIIPIALGLATVPAYLHSIGEDRYGVLVIVWLYLGYFGFFDLGLSRSATNFIARLHDAPPPGRQSVFWTALGLNALFGSLGGSVMYMVAPLVVRHLLTMPEALKSEVLISLPWLALAVPLVAMSGVLVGTLEGRERFATVNAVQVAGSGLVQVLPLGVSLLYSKGLDWLIPSTILARVATMPVLFACVAKDLPLGRNIRFELQLIRPLLGYGGWVAITFLIIPILETIDKAIIGAVLGMRAVSYYAIPFNLVDRFRIIPRAFMRSLFPLFSRVGEEEAKEVASRTTGILAATLTPMIVAGIFLMRPFLTIWLGGDLSLHAAPLGETLLVGIWMNSLAHIPFALVEGRGRPDLLTKLNLLMLPLYLGMFWAGARWYGLEGVAMAWSLRVCLDSTILLGISGLLGRCWVLVRPGALLVASSWIAARFHPASILPGIALISLSIAWAWSIEPRIRRALSNLSSRLIRGTLFNFRKT